jgi:hypothetical protein
MGLGMPPLLSSPQCVQHELRVATLHEAVLVDAPPAEVLLAQLSKLEAKMGNGVLTVAVPKFPESHHQQRRVHIA